MLQSTRIPMLVVALVVLLGLGRAALAQDCETRLTPEEAAALLQQQAAGVYNPVAPPRFVLQIPITAHVVRNTDGSGGLSAAGLAAAIALTNTQWAPAGMQFYQAGSTAFIDNTFWLTGCTTDLLIDALLVNGVVANTINVYFVDYADDDNNPANGTLCGRSSFTTAAVQGVIISNNCLPRGTLAHEIGHYFDLFHTHETMFGVECPSGSNCTTAGDLLCDTPADPTLNLDGMLDTNCNYIGTATACFLPYNPNTRNLMSYAATCRNHFSAQQQARALATLFNARSNLLAGGGGPPTDIWVDFSATGPQTGTFDRPWHSMALALNAASPGSRIVIKAGSSSTPVTVAQPCTVDSFRGSASVGQ